MKGLIFIIFLLFKTIGFGQDTLLTKSDSIVQIAQSQLGIPYKYATSTEGVSFDCSGFTSFVYSSCNVPSSRSSKAYGDLGVEVSLETCRPGDCMIFSGTASGSTTIGHVGIVVSNDENGLKFIHCSSSKKHFGVVITDYYQSNYPKRFLQVRRLF
ncbi:MAG: C40 family peptidase [Fluviicola sp.]